MTALIPQLPDHGEGCEKMSKTAKIRALLKSIETGDPAPVAVVDQAKYIQHNPQTHEGSDGLEVLFERLSRTSPRVNMVRGFQDGNYVFAHMEYDFSSRKIAFEVFRFDDDRAVEHWDNIQPRQEPSPSGHGMVDGPTEAADPGKTGENRRLVHGFTRDVLIGGKADRFDTYFNGGDLIQHSPVLADGAAAFRTDFGTDRRRYHRCHRVLADGNFVLTVCEGHLAGEHSSFYDLYRVEAGTIAEHWETVEKVPPREVWRNDNGKF